MDPEVGLFAAQAVLLGKVASVDGPFWNQLNGQKWEYDGGTGPRESGDYTTPMMYYQVGIEPQQALADEIGLRSPVVEFLVPAFEMDGGESPVPVGLFEVGDRVVTALSVDIFYFRSEPVLALRLFGGTAFHVDQSDMVRPWALVANERARAENPDVPAIDVKPTALASFLDSVESLRSAEKPEWEAYRSVQSETEERLRGILEYLESGDLPAGYDEGPTSTIGGN